MQKKNHTQASQSDLNPDFDYAIPQPFFFFKKHWRVFKHGQDVKGHAKASQSHLSPNFDLLHSKAFIL